MQKLTIYARDTDDGETSYGFADDLGPGMPIYPAYRVTAPDNACRAAGRVFWMDGDGEPRNATPGELVHMHDKGLYHNHGLSIAKIEERAPQKEG